MKRSENTPDVFSRRSLRVHDHASSWEILQVGQRFRIVKVGTSDNTYEAPGVKGAQESLAVAEQRSLRMPDR
jgi:hypothetical protein